LEKAPDVEVPRVGARMRDPEMIIKQKNRVASGLRRDWLSRTGVLYTVIL